MRAVAHGWKPSRMKSPPSRAVAREFVEADRKYSGGFAENRYARGGLAFMNEVDSNSERARPLRGFQFGGGTAGIAGMYRRAQEMAEGSQDPDVSPYGTEAGTTQQMLDRMGWSGPMGYLKLTSGLRQAGWEPASGSGEGDLANTMWYPPEGTVTGGPGGPSEPPPRIIEADPASYIGASASAPTGESPHREQLRQHKARIAATLGSARGGHVNYYQEGGAARSGHPEDTGEKGPNPHDPAISPAAYKHWESRFHQEPPPPEEVVAAPAPEKVPWYMRIAGYGSEEEAAAVDDVVTGAQTGQAYGGRVGYQLGGLAIAAPAGGVPPWIEPSGSGPGFMEEEIPGYQFGGSARGYRGVPPQRGGIRRGMGRPRRGGFRSRLQQQRGAQPGGPGFRGLVGGGQPGGLAAMMRQAQQQRGAMPGGGRLPPGIDPRAVAANPQGWARQQAEMQRQQTGGGPGGGVMGRIPMDMQPGPFNRTPSGEIDLGGGRTPEWGPGMPGRVGEVGINPPPSGPFRPPVGREVIGGSGKFGDPYQYGRGSGGKPRPGPGMMPPGEEGGGIPGGPRVPPNQRGFFQKQRMMNRPPANVGGGANRVGMQDQQGALSRAMQRGTGRAPPSRRFGRGRAGAGRGFQQR